jgi:hypothetical protein
MSSLCNDGSLGHEVCFMRTALIKLTASSECSSAAEFPLKMQSCYACLYRQVAHTRFCKSVISQSHKICTQNSILITAMNNSTSLPAVANSVCGCYCLHSVCNNVTKLNMEYYDPHSHTNSSYYSKVLITEKYFSVSFKVLPVFFTTGTGK